MKKTWDLTLRHWRFHLFDYKPLSVHKQGMVYVKRIGDFSQQILKVWLIWSRRNEKNSSLISSFRHKCLKYSGMISCTIEFDKDVIHGSNIKNFKSIFKLLAWRIFKVSDIFSFICERLLFAYQAYLILCQNYYWNNADS